MKKAALTFLFSAAFCTFSVLTLKGMETNIEEIWKDVNGYEGLYQVSSHGRLKSVKGIRKLQVDSKGYLRTRLSKSNKLQSYRIHRLVAYAFIPNPENKPQVNHKNGIRSDNHFSNLEWATNLENNHHSWRELNRKHHGSLSSRKPVYQVSLDGFFIAEYDSVSEAQRQTGIAHIACVARGDRNHAGGFRWHY